MPVALEKFRQEIRHKALRAQVLGFQGQLLLVDSVDFAVPRLRWSCSRTCLNVATTSGSDEHFAPQADANGFSTAGP